MDKLSLDEIQKIQDALVAQVNREYEQWFEHIRSERDRKRDIASKVLPQNIPEWQVRINLLWKNIQLENSLFLNDDVDVKFIWDDWVLSRETMQNIGLVQKYDYENQDMNELDEDIVNHNALYWLSVSIIDWWDDDEKAPLSDTIDPLSVIPDPKNWKGSKMRFFWVERTLPKFSIENNPSFFNIDELKFSHSIELEENKRALDDANNQTYIYDSEWTYDIYDHFTIYDWKKVLTTWDSSKQILIRYIEIEPLTKTEELKPTKCKFPIQLHRRKPKYWAFYWVSIADEILQYQDNISVLTNLQMIQARQNALWPDKFVDQNLWIDVSLLNKKQPWGRIIPVRANWPIANTIYNDVPVNPSQFPTQMKQELNQLAETTTWTNSLAFWQSIWGSQTKAEVQTLMQNTNQLLSWVASNYLRGKKEFWESWYRSYSLNMGKWDKKNISLYQKGSMISKSLKKGDFIVDWKVQVYVTSKQQEKINNDKDFAKLNTIANLYIWNMKPWYAMNEFLRKMWDLLSIDWFDSKKYIAPSVDEERATMNLELLNNNTEISWPEPWEDLKTYIDIYKQALDTPAKWKALEEYIRVYIELRPDPNMWMAQWETDATTSAMAMNMVNSDLSNKIPSTQNVAL